MSAVLGSFHVEVCDDMSSIADIRVTGLDASVSMQAGGQTEVFTRLRDIVVSDLKPGIVHRKAVSIVGGQEVFSFRLSLFPGATEGGGYSDMEKVDGKVTLRLGCIQIVYLHQFLMALLTSFSFQSTSADEVQIQHSALTSILLQLHHLQSTLNTFSPP
ncbi:hypothetical protein CgunFtcFv8_017079 [Champsocephalus gunnari]|uniref:VPS13-like middle region domain-containing protein n=1 Tax=Champsocephalus gunnari TaxID=52237 RepID=A0AAN8CRS7_CHAGU|nr:hypothetical protein CgunFtcFv8_017079 [Champsocephalus gunnari]